MPTWIRRAIWPWTRSRSEYAASVAKLQGINWFQMDQFMVYFRLQEGIAGVLAMADSVEKYASMGGSRLVWNALVVTAVTVVAVQVVAVVQKLIWRPWKMRRVMTKQGVTAAPFRLLVGNLHECFAYAAKFDGDLHVDGHYDSTPTVSPMNTLYFPKNGKFYLYAWGAEPRLATRDPEFAKEVLLSRAKDFKMAKKNAYILGEITGREQLAIISNQQHDVHRRLLNPFFFPEALKAMVGSMVEGAVSTIQTWEEKVTEGGVAEFDVLPDAHIISGKIFSLTAFSTDFEKGQQLYENQKMLITVIFKALASPLFWLPGYRLLPTKTNREIERLKRQNWRLLKDIIGNRKKAVANGTEKSYGNDLLGHMLRAAEGAGAAGDFTLNSVFNNAEAFYFAGQDTVANAMAFTMLMLARHPEWQDRARKEVTEVCGSRNGALDASKLTQLKTVGMIIDETLRLFVILPKVAREADKDMQIGGLFIPKGMVVEISIQGMHLDPALWGEDVFEFNPERFTNGTSNACTHPQAFLPFSTGPKFCIGTNFAIMELKVVLVTVLQRFQILVSPNYKHHPSLNFIQRPKYGMPLILKTL